MAQTFESGYVSTLSAKLSAADTTMYVATVPTVTKGRLFLKSGNTKEWIKFTGVSGSTLTGLVRGLSKTADPSTTGTGLSWVAGTTVTLVAMHDQLSDKQEGLPVKVYATTAARDSDITSPSNGMSCYITASGTFSDYIAGAWANRPTSAVSDGLNASATVAGRVEIATTAQSLAGTDTGDTGALLSALPSDIAKNTQSSVFTYAASTTGSDTYLASLVPALTAYATGMQIRITFTTANTGACSINLNSLGAKNIKTLAGNDPANGHIAAASIHTLVYDGTNFQIQKPPTASTTEPSIAEMATDAEVVTGTDETRYVNPKQSKPLFFTGQSTGSTNAENVTVTFTHSLGRVPLRIELQCGFTPSGSASNTIYYSNGYLANGTQLCMRIGTGTGGFASNQATYAGYLADYTGTTVIYLMTINNLTTTTFDVVINRSVAVTNTIHLTACVQA